jgi:hypothetical protein
MACCSSRPARRPTAIQHGLRARLKPRLTYTADTLRDLRAEYDKGAGLIFILGADHLAQVLRRHRSREHLRLSGARRLPGAGTPRTGGAGRIGARKKGGTMSSYTHVPHARTLERLEHRDKPVKTADVLRAKANVRFNAWLAVKITDGVGTMWCAYVFAAVALIGLPPALRPGGEGIIAWIAQTFLQLVLLSIIIVGQNIAAAASDARSENTFKDAEAILSEALEIQKHLQSQDEELIAALKDALSKVPAPLR